MAQENNPNPEERKLEPYHYEAMIRAEVEKRMAAEKERTGTQNIVPRDFPEPQSQPLVQPNNPGWPVPGQPGGYPTVQPYPNQPQQYYSGQLPAYQQPQPQPQPPAYYQPQPMPYYPPPPPSQPVINVVVQSTNVNQNVNRNYYGRRGHTHGHIGCFNVCYFLLIGWCFGMTLGFIGLCVLPFSKEASDGIMRMAFFLSFLA